MPRIHEAAGQGYEARSKTYVSGRPGYPPETGIWLREVLGLGSGRSVVDLGAGTGKFLPNLLETGAEVIAVEPVAAMRARLSEAFPQVKALEGTAEQIPLPAQSADAIVCAQAFHWFATPAALAEMHRVLKPGGMLGLIWNVRDERVDWVARLSALIDPHGGDAPRYRSGKWRQQFPAAGFRHVGEAHFRNDHVGPAEDVIVGRTLSVSFIAALPPAEQEAVVRQVREFIAATPALSGPEVAFPYETAAFAYQRTC
ncbi:class I SAM-dependent methyltransferase [Sandaracinobacteroides hominis]|uniref:class I SAM-dependent methyltransferase n=1 Tax=Sandaracinobacteroides hominis TaxID=2780086 RepID=UPI0018F668A3|nr:class I SAM-dependent methyltransferase [Sandaracinobacteroides hominis]